MPKCIGDPVPRYFALFITFRALGWVDITVGAVEAGIINFIATNLRIRTAGSNRMLEIWLVSKDSAILRTIILSRGHLQTSNKHSQRPVARCIII